MTGTPTCSALDVGNIFAAVVAYTYWFGCAVGLSHNLLSYFYVSWSHGGDNRFCGRVPVRQFLLPVVCRMRRVLLLLGGLWADRKEKHLRLPIDEINYTKRIEKFLHKCVSIVPKTVLFYEVIYR
jgi:hypothetical protein